MKLSDETLIGALELFPKPLARPAGWLVPPAFCAAVADKVIPTTTIAP
jgi:hypothetical protein